MEDVNDADEDKSSGLGQNDIEGHEGTPVILFRKNNRIRILHVPEMTASKKFNQLIVKSPFASDDRERYYKDVQAKAKDEQLHSQITFHLH